MWLGRGRRHLGTRRWDEVVHRHVDAGTGSDATQRDCICRRVASPSRGESVSDAPLYWTQHILSESAHTQQVEPCGSRAGETTYAADILFDGS